MIDGVSARALAEIARLERTRNHLRPGGTAAALRRWRAYVHRSERRLWEDYAERDLYWFCCGCPWDDRDLLETVMLALSPRHARQLRAVVARFDARWDVPVPPWLPPDGWS
ncbi:hypothetical protein GCM10010519_44050 [Streptomyces lactacystinicus]|uniref:hypothetical protein n=1 Tax=unclassified Kitasatospora TaxID=2633591 RepID=UPI003380AF92